MYLKLMLNDKWYGTLNTKVIKVIQERITMYFDC